MDVRDGGLSHMVHLEDLKENHGCQILLTADKTLMSDYGNSLFYGFLSAAPRKGLGIVSPGLMFKFLFHGPRADSMGRAQIATMGLRRIESSLLASGRFQREDVVISSPGNLSKFISDTTKMIGISVIDPMGRGPASSTFGGEFGLTHEEPFNAYNFRKLVRSSVVQDSRARGIKLVVGGPGAWQLGPEEMKGLGIDVVVDGEADLTFPDIAEKIINGKLDTPTIIRTDFASIPEAYQLLPNLGATVGGLVEISRGCGRGCKFCMPTLRKIRYRSIPNIISDVRTNVENGQPNICLHSEDILRYGAFGVIPDHDKVIELFKAVHEVPGIEAISVSHAALASIASSPRTVAEVSEIMGLDRHNWLGFQTGIETGSPDLIQQLMNRKAAPFKSSEWPHVVENAFAICHDNNWVPAGTLVINFPGEREQDVLQTVELIESLRNYRSFIVPLLFVPWGDQQCAPMRLVEDAKYYHFELYRAVWRHDMRWANVIADDYVRSNNLMTKIALRTILGLVKGVFSPQVERFINKRIEESKRPEQKLVPLPQRVIKNS